MLTTPLKLTTIIQAPPALVWDYLTIPSLMKQWMGEEDMKLEIITDWKVGHPIIIRGFHHLAFENKGTVLQFEPHAILTYDHLNSVSRLADTPENHTCFEFKLEPLNDQTSLTLTLSNFPTESIYKHLDFYWKTTIGILVETIIERAKV